MRSTINSCIKAGDKVSAIVKSTDVTILRD